MVMEAKALEARPIGDHEIRITNVWTVEATNEFGSEHDTTPNWKERSVPVVTGFPGTFRLRIHAEAGKALVESVPAYTYTLVVRAVCLTNPTLSGDARMLLAIPIGETFGGATAWEHRVHEDMYTRDWSIPIPPFPAMNLTGAPADLTEQVWQYYVILRHTPGAGAVKEFACYGVSEQFLLLTPAV